MFEAETQRPEPQTGLKTTNQNRLRALVLYSDWLFSKQFEVLVSASTPLVRLLPPLKVDFCVEILCLGRRHASCATRTAHVVLMDRYASGEQAFPARAHVCERIAVNHALVVVILGACLIVVAFRRLMESEGGNFRVVYIRASKAST